MPERLAFLVWSATPDRPELCVTPLVHALAARALDAEVELHFAGPAVRWLVAGVADARYPTAAGGEGGGGLGGDGQAAGGKVAEEKTPEERSAGEKSIGDFLREAIAADVRLLACSMARAAWVGDGETLLPQAGAAGATAFVARSLDADWRTLVF